MRAVLAVALVATLAVTTSGLSQNTGRRGGDRAALRQSPPALAKRDQRLRGFVLPIRQVEMLTPLEEILREVHVDEGDSITEGQLLAQLDDALQVVVVAAAQIRADSVAEIESSAADKEDAEVTLERMQSAFDQNAAIHRATAAHTAALEAHTLAQANLDLEKERLDRYRIMAPFDGTVISVLAEAGGMLLETDKIVTLADLSTLEANLHLPVDMYGALEVGGEYTLLAETPVNEELAATLKFMSPIIDTASRTFHCIFTIENEDGRLPAGFTVYLREPVLGGR
jgi:RND family efflux transporter MFP subunit